MTKRIECGHNYFSDMIKTKKGMELHCSNCGFNYGLLGSKCKNSVTEFGEGN